MKVISIALLAFFASLLPCFAAEEWEQSLQLDELSEELAWSQKVQKTYIRIKESVKNSSADEFSNLLDECFIDFFGVAFEDIGSLADVEMRDSWLRSLDSGMKILSLNADPQLPILYFLLYDDEVSHRASKIASFAKFGGFIVPFEDFVAPKSINDSNLHYALCYLDEHSKKDENIALLILDIVFSSQENKLNFDKEHDAAYQYTVNYLRANHSKLLIDLLYSFGPRPALKLLDIIFASNIEVVHSFKEDGTQITIPVGCSLLDELLFMMQKQKILVDRLDDPDDPGYFEPNGTFNEFVDHYLNQRTFSKDNYVNLQNVRLNNPNILDENQWQAMIKFLDIGVVRDALLTYLGRTYLSKLVKENLSDEFEEFVKYLRRNKMRLHMLEFSEGIDRLFLLDDDESLVMRAASNRSYELLCLLIFMLGDKTLQYDSEQNSCLYKMLVNDDEKPIGFESLESEQLADKILRLFIYSDRIAYDLLVQALTTRNSSGETCLSLVASQGMFLCFETIRSYLLTRDSFNQNDHVDAEELNFRLLKGMKARTESMHIRAIDSQKEILDRMIENYFSLEEFNESDEEHQEFVQLIILKLEQFFAKKDAPDNRSTIHYQRAFKMIRKYFEKGIKSRAFIRAPLAIQISYYNEPLRYLIKKVIDDFPSNLLDADKIFALMIDDLVVIPGPLKVYIKQVIEDECSLLVKANKRPGGNPWKNSAKWLAWASFNSK